jgi:hypothetical protein
MRLVRIFRLPLAALPVLIWIYFVVCFVVHPQSPIWHYHFVDPDDYLYLVQASDWLKGQSWFDQIQHRIDPPVGVFIHYSHLLSGLYAIPIFFLTPWLGALNAATVAAVFFPLLFLAGLLAALRWAALPLMDLEWSWVTAFVALFGLFLIFQFMPGRVDHHGLEAVFAIAAFGCMARFLLAPEAKMAILAGGILALALAIGLEILPVLLLMSAWIGLWVLIKGKSAAQTGVAFGTSLFVCSLIFLLLTKSPTHLMDARIDSFSIVYVALMFGIGLWFAALYPARKKSLRFRYGLGIASASVLGALFAIRFPEALGGPFGLTVPLSIRIVLNHGLEARSFLSGGFFTRLFFPPLLALATLGVLIHLDRRLRWPAGLLMCLLAMTYALAFDQQRMLVYAEAFSVIPLAIFLHATWIATHKMKDRLLANALCVMAVLLVGPLTVIMPLFFTGKSAIDIFTFPVQNATIPCDQNGLIQILDTRYGDRPRLIMSTLGQSMELLFRTPHKVVAGPYHTDIESNLASYQFFTAPNPALAKKIAHERHVELVAVCKNLESIYLAGNPYSDADGEENSAHLFFVQKLVAGEVPAWLKPIDPQKTGAMLLFEVK